MDLISEHNWKNFAESAYKRLDEDYPYMESNTDTIPTQYLESKLCWIILKVIQNLKSLDIEVKFSKGVL